MIFAFFPSNMKVNYVDSYPKYNLIVDKELNWNIHERCTVYFIVSRCLLQLRFCNNPMYSGCEMSELRVSDLCESTCEMIFMKLIDKLEFQSFLSGGSPFNLRVFLRFSYFIQRFRVFCVGAAKESSELIFPLFVPLSL
jgi:hypothetical protein